MSDVVLSYDSLRLVPLQEASVPATAFGPAADIELAPGFYELHSQGGPVAFGSDQTLGPTSTSFLVTSFGLPRRFRWRGGVLYLASMASAVVVELCALEPLRS